MPDETTITAATRGKSPQIRVNEENITIWVIFLLTCEFWLDSKLVLRKTGSVDSLLVGVVPFLIYYVS